MPKAEKSKDRAQKDSLIANEQQVLDSVLSQVVNDRAAIKKSLDYVSSPDVEAGVRAAGDRIDLNRPYFGQFSVVLTAEPDRELDLRIGREGAQTSPQIVHWDAEVANAYHMRPGEPGVTGRYNIFQRREIDIEEARVQSMSSSYGFGAPGVVKADRPAAQAELPAADAGAEPSRLTRALDRNREQGFDDIVETIQPDQMIEIARSTVGPLLLDGVAGSGKTTVALHRIAYITSPRRNTGERIDINRVLALGPSQQFIRWSSKIRDVLDMGPLRYDTVPGFMWSWLSAVLGNRRIKFEQPSEYSPVRTPNVATVARVESSIRIACSIPEGLRSASTAPKFVLDLPFKRDNVEKRMNPSDWQKFWKSGPQLITVVDEEKRPSVSTPYIDLYRAKQYFEPGLTGEKKSEDSIRLLTQDFESLVDALGTSIPSDITGTILLLIVPDEQVAAAQYIRDHDNQAVAFIKSGSWTQRSKDYEGISGLQIRKLSEVSRREELSGEEIARLAQRSSSDANHPLSGRAMFAYELERLGLGLGRRLDVGNEGNKNRVLKEGWEPQVKVQIREFVDTHWPLLPVEQLLPWPIGREDEDSDQPDRHSLAVLCAAVARNIALDDDLRGILSHVVVDEVQELSEAEILFLAGVANQQSLTLVGDLRQSLVGIDDGDDWNMFRSMLGNELEISSFNKSYRSTAAITRFCNEILRVRGISRLAEPYDERPGEPVITTSCTGPAQHDASVMEWIRTSLKTGGSILLVAPETDSRSLIRHYRLLIDEVIQQHEREESVTTEEGIVAVMMPSEVKGLEYNHVAIVRADAVNYPRTPSAGALLYVGCTRATTTLNLFFVGEGSPFIVSEQTIATTPIATKGPAELRAEQQLAQYKAGQLKTQEVEERRAKERAAASAREMLALIEDLKAPPATPKRAAKAPPKEKKASSSAPGWSIFGRSEVKPAKAGPPAPKAKGWSIFGSGDAKPKKKRKNSDWIKLGEDEE